MKALITGAGGAIGVHVIAHLLEETDWDLVGVDSLRKEHKGYVDRITTLIEDRERLELIVHNLNSPFTSRQIEKIGKVDYIINLASRSDVQNSVEDPEPFVRNNVELMINILQYAREAKPKAFIHFSTDEVYGPAPKESSGHKEWEAILPSNPYSASKACQEALAVAWWRCYDVPVIITNTMNNFGETQAPSKFPAMIQSKIEKGETINVHVSHKGEIGSRYYLHSRNAADALLYILTHVEPYLHRPGEIDRPFRFNIVGDKQVSNLDLVLTIAKLMGKEPKYQEMAFHKDNPGHDLHYGLDGTKLKTLGWKPPLGYEESLKQTIDWQKEHPEWMI